MKMMLSQINNSLIIQQQSKQIIKILKKKYQRQLSLLPLSTAGCQRYYFHTTTIHNSALKKTTTNDDVKHLLACMNHRPDSVITHPDDRLKKYNTDWRKQYIGNSSIVVRPKTAQEVSLILKYCHEQKIGIVPQAGNTGLVGGSVPIKDQNEIILSIELLNSIYSLDAGSGILKCDAGCIIQTLQDYCTDRNYLLPIDLGSKGTCCIGGTVSTNAGGQYYYRYGSLHGTIVGLEVVLPKDGTIMDLSFTNCNRKDNTGYDLKQLFIGAEGTLGICTKVAIACPPQPKSKCIALVACSTFEHSILQLLQLAKQELGEILAAFEYMDQQVLEIIVQQHPNIHYPLSNNIQNYPYCVLIETHGSNQDHDEEKMSHFLEKCMDSDLILDGVLAQDLKQGQEFWNIRELANPSVGAIGYGYKYDISLPISEFPVFIHDMRQHLQQSINNNNNIIKNKKNVTIQNPNWGHVVDGNLHFNIVTPGEYKSNPDIVQALEPFLFETVLQRGGSISAEHGLGQCKNEYLPLIHDETKLSTMQAIKNLFDPNSIMNPGKYLPSR